MSFKNFFKSLGAGLTGGLSEGEGLSWSNYRKGLSGTYSLGTAGGFESDFKNGSGGGGYWSKPSDITTDKLFTNLSQEQQKDLLLNNPTVMTPEGSQSYDPYSNTVSLNESDFTKAQRLRQEQLASQLSGSLNGNLPSSNEEIQNATFERGKALLDPVFKQQKRELSQQLADQGIPLGSEGYNEAVNRLEQSQGRQYTDLSQASIQTAETQRAARFNEIASLLGTAQVGGVGFQQFQPQFSGLDLFGAEQSSLSFNRNAGLQQSMLSKQLKQQNRNAQYQALGSLGGAAIGAAAA